ncbi:hypothetical protein Leryth_017047 [Lithospermum erythrorhizon]|nr:hypothetical protein Leryth_017047 [Lithospermum erythrorhizon]
MEIYGSSFDQSHYLPIYCPIIHPIFAKLTVMGKGGGCFPSKNKAPLGATTVVDEPPKRSNPPPQVEAHSIETTPPVVVQTVAAPEIPQKKVKIFIIFYSMYGHLESLAKKMKEGVDGIEGVEGCLYRVAETLPSDVLEKMHAPPKDAAIPEISAEELSEADGLLFGFPTRFGAMAAQMKALFDSTGGLWTQQKLAGKPAGFFVGTGTQGGGQETTAYVSPSLITSNIFHVTFFLVISSIITQLSCLISEYLSIQS